MDVHRATFTLTLLSSMATSSGLQVYNCDNNAAHYEPISLLEPEPCSDPERDYKEPRNVSLQLLQVQRYTQIEAFQCNVTVTIRVTQCGFDSLTYGTHIVAHKKAVTLTPHECREANEQGILTLNGKRFNLGHGKRLTTTFFSHGFLHTDGTCEREHFVTEGKAFHGYEQTSLEADIEKTYARYSPALEQVILDGGIRGRFSDGHVFDRHMGTFIWDVTE